MESLEPDGRPRALDLGKVEECARGTLLSRA